ncbi:hypothetical protein [Flectobacillus major]|uniref:hypothetical protein n=1 Tax=Flectobacillus major TaxID=103 RepID=UPI00042567D8|nr:hypothetical protein [Flectobacillus major]
MPILNFAQNFNNKLDCPYFTTIRLNTPKYKIGVVFDIELQDTIIKKAEVLDIRILTLDTLDEWTCLLDAGLGLEETISLLKRFYQVSDWNTQELVFVLLKSC